MKRYAYFLMCREQKVEPVAVPEEDPNQPDLSASDKECTIQNFRFYDKQKQGYVELYELPMILHSK